MNWIEESRRSAREAVAKLSPELVDAIKRSGTVETLKMRKDFDENKQR